MNIRSVLHKILVERANGDIIMPPKQSIHIGQGHFFQSLIASSKSHDIAICKWIGLAPSSDTNGGQQTHSTILVSELSSGRPLEVLNGDEITIERTVALSLAAFELSRRLPPETIGFVGGGRQAVAHLRALLDLYPTIQMVCLYEPRPRGRDYFIDLCAAKNIECHVKSTPEFILKYSQLIISSVSGTSENLNFLDARLTRDDVFVSAVDLGRSWDPRAIVSADFNMITDDLPQTQALIERNAFPLPLEFNFDLPSLAVGATAPKTGRIMFSFAGAAYADLAGVIARRSHDDRYTALPPLHTRF